MSNTNLICFVQILSIFSRQLQRRQKTLNRTLDDSYLSRRHWLNFTAFLIYRVFCSRLTHSFAILLAYRWFYDHCRSRWHYRSRSHYSHFCRFLSKSRHQLSLRVQWLVSHFLIRRTMMNTTKRNEFDFAQYDLFFLIVVRLSRLRIKATINTHALYLRCEHLNRMSQCILIFSIYYSQSIFA